VAATAAALSVPCVGLTMMPSTVAHQTGLVPAGPVRDWVALHAAEPFRAGVAALAEQVDQVPAAIPDGTLAGWFGGMLDAEITFHDAVYG
jgi:thiaminase/transcriptional activator TenA